MVCLLNAAQITTKVIQPFSWGGGDNSIKQARRYIVSAICIFAPFAKISFQRNQLALEPKYWREDDSSSNKMLAIGWQYTLLLAWWSDWYSIWLEFIIFIYFSRLCLVPSWFRITRALHILNNEIPVWVPACACESLLSWCNDRITCDRIVAAKCDYSLWKRSSAKVFVPTLRVWIEDARFAI